MDNTAIETGKLPPHSLEPIVLAWLAGKEIQYKGSDGKWYYKAQRRGGKDWLPSFDSDGSKYRVKPEPRVVTTSCRRYLYSNDKVRGRPINSILVLHSNNKGNSDSEQCQQGFIKWIDEDWVTYTYEVEEGQG